MHVAVVEQDFLVESNYLTEEEKEDLINRFDNNFDAEEKIKQYIS